MLPRKVSAYCSRVAGVKAPRSLSTDPSPSRYSVGGALRRSFFAIAGTVACRSVRKPTRQREVGRGERVLPGVWRLRLPLDLPGVPHCNAWALQAGDGIVLVDTGMDDRGSMAHLELPLDRSGHVVQDIRQNVITHAHIAHCGQAPPLAQR